jgi:tungstate transport system substrate-binding protein
MYNYFIRAFLVGLTLFAFMSCSKNETLTIGVTTTLEDSGLLNQLIQDFQKDQSIKIKPIVAASGQIHELIRRGDIDSAITHDPKGEDALFTAGHIKEPIKIMENDFIIVGPATDPAHIKHALTPDEAFEKIANTKNIFITRNDQSGTHQMEVFWWQKAGEFPTGENYLKTGTGMGSTLMITAERNAYTLVDRGTWLNFENKQNLEPLFENQDYLPNQYRLLSLNKQNSSLSEHILIWENWLRSTAVKDLIVNYQIDNQPVFFLSQ